MTTEEQSIKPTLGEEITELYSRVAKLNDAVCALLSPNWGASMGILPEDHPLYPKTLEPLPGSIVKKPRLLDCGWCYEENGEEVHPHPECPIGYNADGQQEQGAPVDWQAIAKQRERELKKVGEARHRAETAVRELRATLAEITARFEPAFPSPKEPMRQQATVSIEDHQRWQNVLEPKEQQ